MSKAAHGASYHNRRTVLVNDEDWKALGDVAAAMGLGDGRGPGRAELIARLARAVGDAARKTEPVVVSAGRPAVVFLS